MRIVPSCAVALWIVLAIAPRATAQDADAEALFREGRRLVKAGEIAKACEKFEASERIDPQSGTEINLADCREQAGQTASAWAMFVKAAESSKHVGDAQREAEAKKRAHALEQRLVYLTIDVPDKSAVEGLVVKRNDTIIDNGMWNQPLPVDPGDYTITADAPGRRTWTETITVKTKDKTIEVPRLPRHRASAAAEPVPPPAPAPEQPVPPPAPPRKYGTTALALAVIGGGSIAVATGFAFYSKSVEDQADAICPSDFCTDPHGVDLNHSARVDGWIANIGWGVGVAALAGAAYAWWAGRPGRADAVSVVPVIGGDRAGLAVGGRF